MSLANSPQAGKGIRILVADDDPAVLELMTEILPRLDCEVFTEANGEGAIARQGTTPEDAGADPAAVPAGETAERTEE
ncbi:MAG: hypothetical protein COZ06_23410 [Armatimonadetes bacterium CG_4_10_14_3_um_filter_66_18]|nr:response regulator [Armatimonadota bacterium]OIP12201.1 MAG: hypothetical protein AUJ96_00780 [Armatimonadetes bacterium CG2_30_66_41]PIU88909.1 MAG: hypothetical protein COS65_29760 [Armatimonadetes bacterium CG06_land_8_20_14_3_00_66_21]PIX38739.1 MAG: hypothetical protein COZ57_29815 [Armatimonadetes bacterium CG_4_8_14_3_um_filter_66_20]PIY43212.1 MAG: hypothetical protein COZ06_23410 [Armatimonadetes bacterium CG_4_10_14_3_um_filter_66_18]PIZ48670.1 MAG: hypothetical protein COY42_0588